MWKNYAAILHKLSQCWYTQHSCVWDLYFCYKAYTFHIQQLKPLNHKLTVRFSSVSFILGFCTPFRVSQVVCGAVSACLCPGPHSRFRSECCTGGKSVTALHQNQHLSNCLSIFADAFLGNSNIQRKQCCSDGFQAQKKFKQIQYDHCTTRTMRLVPLDFHGDYSTGITTGHVA